MAEPFMEHPTGDFASAVEAIEDTIRRLRALPVWDKWITFCAQGEGHSTDSIHVAEVRLRADRLDVGRVPIDIARISELAGVRPDLFTLTGEYYSLVQARPGEVARVLDALFRHQFGIRPFPGDDDYAVGAEW